MVAKRITFTHFNGPAVQIYDETRSVREGGSVQTMIELATDLLGGSAPISTDAAITALVDAGYIIKIGQEKDSRV